MIDLIKKSDLIGVVKLVKNDDVRPFLQIGKYTSLKVVKAFLFSPANVVFVSKNNGVVNGIGIGMLKSGKRAHLCELIIAVSKKFWGKDISTELLDCLECKLSERNIYRFELSSYASNRRAINFYLKNGFVIEGCKRKSLLTEEGNYDDEIIFGKVIL